MGLKSRIYIYPWISIKYLLSGVGFNVILLCIQWWRHVHVVVNTYNGRLANRCQFGGRLINS
jgi:hypothetical protein